QRAERPVPGRRPAGDHPGHRVLQRAADRAGPVRLLDDGRDPRRGRAGERGLRAAPPGGGRDRPGVLRLRRRAAADAGGGRPVSQLLRERVTSPPAAARTGGGNGCGYLRTENGLGAAVRGYVRALRAAEVPVALADVSDLSGNRAGDDTLAGSAGEYPHDVNLVCGDVEQHFAIRARLGEGFFRGRYNVGLWAWELPHFPERWYDRFAHYDEIWVASSFIANALSPVCPVPVVRVPPALTLESPGDRDRGRARLGVADEFVFLFVFDFWSRTARKNPLAVVEAFRRAFSPADPARLVLKCINPGFEK